MARLFGTDGIRGVANVDLKPTARLRPRPGGRARLVGPRRRDRRRPGHAPLGRHVRGRHRGRGDEPRRRRPRRRRRARRRPSRSSPGAARSRPGSWSRPRTTRPTTTASRSSTATASSSTTRSRTSSSSSSGGPRSCGGARNADLGRIDRRDRRCSTTTWPTGSGWPATIEATGCGSCSTAPTARARSSGRGSSPRPGRPVEVIHAEPDGININVASRRDRAGLRWPRRSSRRGADVGFALDGDADRLIAVDARRPGRRRRPGARHPRPRPARPRRAAGRRPRRVGPVERRAAGGRSRRPAARSSGPRSATSTSSRGCRSSGAVLGGEKSGHVIVLEHTTSGDGIVTALEVLRVMAPRGAGLADLAAAIPMLPAATARGEGASQGPVGGRPGPPAGDRRRRSARLGPTGRVLVRPSGTEPALRVMVEGPDEALVAELADSLAALAGSD